MLKLNEKEYNLDNLFGINFDLLKEILIKLAKKSDNTIQEINIIKNTNISRDKRISALEQKITELINNINNSNLKEKEIKNIINEDKKIEVTFEASNDNNNEINFQNNNLISKIDDFIISSEELKQLEENRANTEKNVPVTIEIKNTKDKDIIIKKEKTTEKTKEKKINKLSSHYKEKPFLKKKFRTDINLITINEPRLLTPEKSKEKNDSPKIRNLMHEISCLKDRINYIEKNLLLKNSETLQISKDLLAEHNKQSMSKFNSLSDQVNNLSLKNDNLDKALNQLAQKIEENSSVNIGNNGNQEIIRILNDNDEDENKDKKLMSRTFMDSINRRFELNNDRYMKAFEDTHKMKQNITNIFGICGNLKRQIDLMKKNSEGNNEEINKIKDQLNDLIEIRNHQSNNNDKNIPIQNVNDINSYIDKKMNELMEYLLNEEDPNEKNNEGNNNPHDQSSKKEKALIKLMNKKVNQLNEKIDLIEEESKLQKKNFNMKYKEIDNIIKRINELNDLLSEKLEQKDLDELYNKSLKNTDEINKMKLKVDEIYIAQEKLRSDNPNFVKRLESLTHEVSEMKENLLNQKGDFTVVKKEYNTKVEEFGNEEENDKIKNMVSPLAEEIQKIIIEIENINLKIKNINELNKLFPKKKSVEKLESNLYEKINSIENNFDAKYLRKSEFQKTLKTLDIQIKQLQGNSNSSINQKAENENWILAKQPLKCFNCASCEANVSSNSIQQEPISWNKYHGQYRIGQGFSKLLNKLNTNRISEDKEKDLNKTEKRNKISSNSLENFEGNNLLMVNNKNENIKINNKIIGTEDKPFSINLKKHKLPRLIESFKRKQKSTDLIPVSDEEKDEHSDLEELSPQILKIKKLKNDDLPDKNFLEINNQLKNKTGRNSANKSNNISRIQSLPLY